MRLSRHVGRLQDHPGEAIADNVPNAAVLFVSLPNYTDIVQAVGRDAASTTLNSILCAFDATLRRFPRVEKIKSHGSTYLAAAGLAGDQHGNPFGKEVARERVSEGARKRFSEGARERGSERERGKEGARERGRAIEGVPLCPALS